MKLFYYLIVLLCLCGSTYLKTEEAIEEVEPIATINKAFEVKYERIDGVIDEELRCLTKALYFEGRGLSEKSQALIGMAVLNRVKSKHYPNTICKVVYQKSNNPRLPKRCQFSFTCSGQSLIITEHLAWDKALRISHKLINGEIKIKLTAMHYTKCTRKISWQDKMKLVYNDGVHCYYEDKR